jgi:hypothetical protein
MATARHGARKKAAKPKLTKMNAPSSGISVRVTSPVTIEDARNPDTFFFPEVALSHLRLPVSVPPQEHAILNRTVVRRFSDPP